MQPLHQQSPELPPHLIRPPVQFRVSLRLVIVGVSILLGLLLWGILSQRDLEQEVDRIGGVIAPRRSESNFQRVLLQNFLGYEFADTYVSLQGTNLDDAWLARNLALLKQKPQLVLDLVGTNITDQSIRLLSKLKNLSVLDIGNTAVTDDGLRSLAGHRRLRIVRVEGTRVTSAGLKMLSSLPELEYVGLDSIQWNQNTLEVIKSSPRLTGVIMTAANDEIVSQLAIVPRLTDLWIQGKDVTDRSLEAVSNDKSLIYLTLLDCDVSQTAVDLLHQKIPGLILRQSTTAEVQNDRQERIAKYRAKIESKD